MLVGVLAERFFDFKLQRRQWLGLVVLGVGTGVLAATAHSKSDQTSYRSTVLVCFELLAVGFGVACAFSLRSQRLRDHQGVLLGVSAGIWFGASDVSIKAVTSGAHGVWSILGPRSWIGILCGVGAFFASARSFQIGDGVGVIAANSAAANLLGIIAGILLFGEPLGNNLVTVTGRLVAFTLVVLALALVPAPVRAEDAARPQEMEKAHIQSAEKGSAEAVSGEPTRA